MALSPQPQADPSVTFHASRFAFHALRLTPYASRLTFHASRFTPHASRLTVPLNSILLALLCFIFAACSTTAPTGNILFDDPRGTVSLQTISDRSIQASHPINLDQTLLTKILQGIEVQDQAFGLQKLFAGPSSPTPAFSDDQIRFLAPLLTEGLQKAAPDQSVEFRTLVTYPGSTFEPSITETTAGSLYAYGRQIYLTLSQYRSSMTRANQNSGRTTTRTQPPDFTGLRDHILLFTPKAAQRSDSFDPPARAKSTDRFLAVDYQLLQQTPPAAGTSASEAQTHNTEALAQEVEALRRELQSVQKQLGSPKTQKK